MTTTATVGGVVAHYDSEADALAVDLPGSGQGASVKQVRLDASRIVDYDEAGVPVSVEILGASRGITIDGLPAGEEVRAAAEQLGLPVYQTVEELRAHYASGGPADAAQLFLHSVLDRGFPAAWDLLDPVHRLVRAQAWLFNNRLSRDLEKGLSESPPHGRYSRSFSKAEMRVYRESYLGRWNPERWGTASRPRPLAPGLEMVILIDTGGEALRLDRPTALEGAISLIMRFKEGRWRVASFSGAGLPEPGWPPTIP